VILEIYNAVGISFRVFCAAICVRFFIHSVSGSSLVVDRGKWFSKGTLLASIGPMVGPVLSCTYAQS